jgi:sulfate adenylyltransferase
MLVRRVSLAARSAVSLKCVLSSSTSSLLSASASRVPWRAFALKAHGGKLVNLIDSKQQVAWRAEAVKLPTLRLTQRHLCDIELILNGAFSPLDGFMNRGDYESVCSNLRLANGTLFPLPITLDVSEHDAGKLRAGSSVTLVDAEGDQIAILDVGDVWRPDLKREAEVVFGTTEHGHSGAAHLLEHTKPVYVGGKLRGLQLPQHYDYVGQRHTPAELRAKFAADGWERVVAFQTRNPMHRAHLELTVRAAETEKAHILIHPVVGMTKPGDVDHHTRVKCYKAVMPSYPKGLASMSLLNLAMRMGGPREAVLHAIIRKNYGATHFIIGRDHAGPGDNAAGKPFYGPYEAQELVAKYEKELEIKCVLFQAMLYVPAHDKYYPVDQLPAGEKTLNISGTELRRRLRSGEDIPNWFSYERVVKILRASVPSKAQQGLTIFFTGLSGSGKSTIANALLYRLLEESSRPISLLDGDHVRVMLSSELGFSKEHRDLNIKRIGYVASLVNKARGIAICAPIAPYDATRRYVRRINEHEGGYVEIYVSTSLAECERRDRKGLYAKARAGKLQGMTGIDDPYEAPTDAEIVIDAEHIPIATAVEKIVQHLRKSGYLPATTE